MSSPGALYRILIIMVILVPYKLFTAGNGVKTSFLMDFLVAAAAFGLGYLFFPARTDPPRDKKPKGDDLIDQDEQS